MTLALGAIAFGPGALAEEPATGEASQPLVLPEITVVARRPPYDPARESGSLTVLNRDTLARSEERELNADFHEGKLINIFGSP